MPSPSLSPPHDDAVSLLVDLALAERPAATAAAAAPVDAPKRSHRVGSRKSDFLGVGWDKSARRWRVYINHNGKRHNQGQFDDEQEGARAFDTAARLLRPKGEAHGGRSGSCWLRLNFPTAEEEAFAAQQGMRGTGAAAAEKTAEVALNAEAQGFRSDYLGVSWPKKNGCRQWKAEIRHNGEQRGLGRFDDEQEAARAYDTAARRLRPKGEAHGGKSGTQWKRLNFPTAEEAAFTEEHQR